MSNLYFYGCPHFSLWSGPWTAAGSVIGLGVKSSMFTTFRICAPPTSSRPWRRMPRHAAKRCDRIQPGEFKMYLKCWQDKAKTTQELILLTETAAHDLNHLKRRGLSGKTACQEYFAGDRVKYGKRERYRIYHWIRDLAIRISEGLGKTVIVLAAWRVAAKSWMERNNLITILKPEEVLPNLSPDLCHH